MIVLDDVWHTFDDRPVLRGVSLELRERRIGIIGANGSGKSTLARTFNGLVLPDRGSVRTLGLDVRKQRAQVRAQVGFLFADASAQIVMPTPAEDVALSLKPRGRRRRKDESIDSRVLEILNEFGLGDHADAPAQLMSSGQKQMLALASVLVTRPKILVCDEPTTLLDLRNVIKVRERLDAMDQQVILLTHHLEMLDGYDRVVVMDAGAVVFDGAPAPAVAAYRDLATR